MRRDRLALSVFVAFSVVAGTPWAPGAVHTAQGSDSGSETYSLESKTVAHVVGTLTYDVTYPSARASEWVVFAAQTPTLPGQIKVRTSLAPPGEAANDESDMARSLLMARVPAHGQSLHSLSVKVIYEATLRSRKLRRGSPSRRDTNLTAEERAMYLVDRGFLDFKSPAFTEWMTTNGIARTPGEGEIAFARRIFLGLKSGMQYDASGTSREFRASAVCKTGRAECGGLSVLFASILRANKIPARTLWGRWAHSAEEGKTWANHPYFQTHVKAEFFARGVGWIPVDVSSGILHDKSPQGLRFFGNDPGNFITFHVDPNLVVDTHLFGVKPVAHLQRPLWWLKAEGSLENAKTVQDWQVKRAKVN